MVAFDTVNPIVNTLFVPKMFTVGTVTACGVAFVMSMYGGTWYVTTCVSLTIVPYAFVPYTRIVFPPGISATALPHANATAAPPMVAFDTVNPIVNTLFVPKMFTVGTVTACGVAFVMSMYGCGAWRVMTTESFVIMFHAFVPYTRIVFAPTERFMADAVQLAAAANETAAPPIVALLTHIPPTICGLFVPATAYVGTPYGTDTGELVTST
jgi:hypothetical protein